MTLAALIGNQSMSAQTAVSTTQRNTTPLEYVAEYHMGTNKRTGAFATSHNNDSCGWYTPDEAKRLCPKGYHVPSEYEMFILLPQQLNTYKNRSVENCGFGTKVYRNHPEEVEIAGVKTKYTAEYMGVKEYPRVKYGIRFIGNGNRYRSAYRYEQAGHFGANSEGGYGDRKSYLLIQSKYLGNDGTLEDVAKEEFWQTGNIVTRVIPANGKLEDRGNWFNAKIGSMFSIMAFSGTPISLNYLEYEWGDLFFWRFQGFMQNNYLYDKTCVVRPFLNKLPDQPVYNASREVHMTYTATVEKRPNLPIDYVADFNVGDPGYTFNITEEGANGSKFENCPYSPTMPQGYHIPTLYEMTGIFPEEIYGQNNDLNWTPYEKITINGVTSTYQAHYLYYRNRQYDFTCYALKFMDKTNEYLSAYKYEFDRLTYNLKVSCRYLGPNFKGEVHELTYPEFWMTEDVITVKFPMTHDFYKGNALSDILGNYSIIDDGQQKPFAISSYRMGLTKARAFHELPLVVRPFKNSLKSKAPTKAAQPGAKSVAKKPAARSTAKKSAPRQVQRKK